MTLGAALYDAFGKTYILNLKRSLDRKLSMEKKCSSINLNYEFFEAFDGDNFILPFYTKGGYMNSNQLGEITTSRYYAAQYALNYVVHRAINNGVKSFIFMNDDVYFDNYQNFTDQNFLDIKNKIPDNWDIIVLGNMFHTIPYSGEIAYEQNNYHTKGCQALAINHTAYHDIISQSVPITDVVGDHLNDHLRSIGKNIYHSCPDICLQDRSIITTMI
jgi:hypothetical protein